MSVAAYDVDANGGRFIVSEVPDGAGPSSITLVTDWVALTRTR